MRDILKDLLSISPHKEYLISLMYAVNTWNLNINQHSNSKSSSVCICVPKVPVSILFYWI
jgi:hypothetical protein